MSDAIVVAILSLVGTAVGSVVSVLTANRLTNYKIDALQKQVEKHNSVVERTFAIEQKLAVQGEQIKVANNRIEDLEKASSK